ncbi:MAG: hypothetical protein VXZ72_02705 [Chlamydiota bacterium]|nr:hypothetical protein [Chlamydiota bacterium]
MGHSPPCAVLFDSEGAASSLFSFLFHTKEGQYEELLAAFLFWGYHRLGWIYPDRVVLFPEGKRKKERKIAGVCSRYWGASAEAPFCQRSFLPTIRNSTLPYSGKRLLMIASSPKDRAGIEAARHALLCRHPDHLSLLFLHDKTGH